MGYGERRRWGNLKVLARHVMGHQGYREAVRQIKRGIYLPIQNIYCPLKTMICELFGALSESRNLRKKCKYWQILSKSTPDNPFSNWDKWESGTLAIRHNACLIIKFILTIVSNWIFKIVNLSQAQAYDVEIQALQDQRRNLR